MNITHNKKILDVVDVWIHEYQSSTGSSINIKIYSNPHNTAGAGGEYWTHSPVQICTYQVLGFGGEICQKY